MMVEKKVLMLAVVMDVRLMVLSLDMKLVFETAVKRMGVVLDSSL